MPVKADNKAIIRRCSERALDDLCCDLCMQTQGGREFIEGINLTPRDLRGSPWRIRVFSVRGDACDAHWSLYPIHPPSTTTTSITSPNAASPAAKNIPTTAARGARSTMCPPDRRQRLVNEYTQWAWFRPPR